MALLLASACRPQAADGKSAETHQKPGPKATTSTSAEFTLSSDGRVQLFAAGGKVRAVDLAAGRTLWEKDAGGEVLPYHLGRRVGNVALLTYIDSTRNACVAGLDVARRRIRFAYRNAYLQDVSDKGVATLVTLGVGPDAGFTDSSIMLVDVASGRQVTSYPHTFIPNRLGATQPVIGDDLILVESPEMTIAAREGVAFSEFSLIRVNRNTGRQAWKKDVRIASGMGTLDLLGCDDSFITLGGILDRYHWKVLGFSAKDGRLLWQNGLPGVIYTHDELPYSTTFYDIAAVQLGDKLVAYTIYADGEPRVDAYNLADGSQAYSTEVPRGKGYIQTLDRLRSPEPSDLIAARIDEGAAAMVLDGATGKILRESRNLREALVADGKLWETGTDGTGSIVSAQGGKLGIEPTRARVVASKQGFVVEEKPAKGAAYVLFKDALAGDPVLVGRADRWFWQNGDLALLTGTFPTHTILFDTFAGASAAEGDASVPGSVLFTERRLWSAETKGGAVSLSIADPIGATTESLTLDGAKSAPSQVYRAAESAAVVTASKGRLDVWTAKTGRNYASAGSVPWAGEPPRWAASDGSILVTCAAESRVVAWDAASGKRLWEFTMDEMPDIVLMPGFISQDFVSLALAPPANRQEVIDPPSFIVLDRSTGKYVYGDPFVLDGWRHVSPSGLCVTDGRIVAYDTQGRRTLSAPVSPRTVALKPPPPAKKPAEVAPQTEKE